MGIPLNGWILRIYRGETPALRWTARGSLFVDGFKLLVIGLIYSLPGHHPLDHPLPDCARWHGRDAPSGRAGRAAGRRGNGKDVRATSSPDGAPDWSMISSLPFSSQVANPLCRGVMFRSFNFGAITATIKKIG